MATDELSDFGGLVTTLTPPLLEPGEATRAEFVDLNDGIIEAALGRKELFAGVTAGSGVVTTIIHWRKLSGAVFTIVCTTSDIYRIDFATSTFVSIKPGAYTITGTRAWWWTHAAIADKIVLTNGTDAPLEWDGIAATMATLTLPAGVTAPKFVLWWKNRLHLFNLLEGGADKPYRHWWSELFVYNAWTTANGAGTLDYTGGGEPINGVVDLENVMLLLRQNRATIIAHTGLSASPFASRDLEHIRGTYAPFSIQLASVGVFYLAVDGLRIFDGVQSKLVSGHIDAFSNIPITSLTKASSVLDSVFKRYLIALPSTVGGNNDTVWNVLYQFYPGEQMEFSRRPYSAPTEIRALGKFIRLEDFTWQSFPASGAGSTWEEQTIAWNDPKTSGEFEEVLAGGYAGQVWLYEEVPSDLGVAIPMVWESGTFPRGTAQGAIVRLMSMVVSGVLLAQTTVELDLIEEDTDAVKFTTTIDFAARSRTVIHPNRSFFGGFRIRLRNSRVNSIPTIDSLRFEYLIGRKFRA